MTGQQFYQDATVYDAGGEKVGNLHAHDPQGGYITVQKGFLFPKDLYIPVTAVQSTDADGNVRLGLYKDDLADDRYAVPPMGNTTGDDSYAQRMTMAETTTTRAQPPATRTDGDINVPVYEEELVVGTREQEQGRVHLHKDVVTEQATIPVTLQHEEVTVERVPFTGQASQDDLQGAFQDQDFEVPVMGEQAVMSKQARVTEEVRLRKDQVTENQQVSDTVRKERVIVDGVDDTDTGRGADKSSTASRRR